MLNSTWITFINYLRENYSGKDVNVFFKYPDHISEKESNQGWFFWNKDLNIHEKMGISEFKLMDFSMSEVREILNGINKITINYMDIIK